MGRRRQAAGHGSRAKRQTPFACAKLTGIDESSVKNLPGFIKVVSKGNYVAVVCEREEQAIRAARQLKTTWEKPATAPFPASEDLFNYMRVPSRNVHPRQSVDEPSWWEIPMRHFGRGQNHRSRIRDTFQGHTAFAGAHASADPQTAR